MLSIASRGSLLSIGSVGSVASIGSIGSAGSAFGVASAGSLGSLMSAGSVGSVMSAGAAGAVMDRRAAAGQDPRAVTRRTLLQTVLIAALVALALFAGRRAERRPWLDVPADPDAPDTLDDLDG